MAPPDSIYLTKNRIVAVDIARLMAAFLVMFEHLSSGGFIVQHRYAVQAVLANANPLFFVLAGFFACRNITWKKALNNSWWSLAPFLLWNAIAILFYGLLDELPEKFNILTLHGIQTIFIDGWVLFPELGNSACPVNGPLWFMRDLVVLFLLSPILVKWAKYVFPACILLSFIPDFSLQFTNSSQDHLVAPHALAFFSAGCLLQTLDKERQKKILTFYSPALIIGYTAFMTLDWLYFRTITASPQCDLCQSLMGIWIMYQIARWIEVRIPAATPFALKFAPVTFLTFAAHIMLIRIGIPAVWHIHHNLPYTDMLLLIPLAIFSICAAFFFALKRWCPCLLHLVAHYKLRPDDIRPATASSTRPEAGIR